MARYWFRQKTFGYGATPNTWQGWLTTLVGIALILGVAFAGRHMPDHRLGLLVTVGGLALIVIPFLILCYVKTEGGWRWRNGNE
jgi:hypothetical protein